MGLFSTSPPAYQAASIGTTATVLYSGTGVTVGSAHYPYTSGLTISNLTVQNSGTASVFIGGSAVTTATGLELPAGMSVTITGSTVTGASSKFNLWGITAAVTVPTEASLATVDAVV